MKLERKESDDIVSGKERTVDATKATVLSWVKYTGQSAVAPATPWEGDSEYDTSLEWSAGESVQGRKLQIHGLENNRPSPNTAVEESNAGESLLLKDFLCTRGEAPLRYRVVLLG